MSLPDNNKATNLATNSKSLVRVGWNVHQI